MGPASGVARVGIDSVAIERVVRLLRDSDPRDLERLFSADEIRDAGEGEARAAHLAARLAAKEACLKLFPRETALGSIEAADFRFARAGYGAPELAATPKVQELLDRHRVRRVALSLTHEGGLASAVAQAEPAETPVPPLGRWIYHLLPVRRRLVLENLRRAFGDAATAAEIERLAQAHYAHLARLGWEFARLASLRATTPVRVENVEAVLEAGARGKGVLLLTGHFGNWEVATILGIARFPEYRGRFHFVRRPVWPPLLDRVVSARFRRAGFGVLPKRGSLDAILDRLAAGDVVVFVMDQHAGGRDGVEVDLFGHPAWTFRSLAVLALASGAPVVPAASWRERGGSHVVRFEQALAPIEHDDPGQAIRENTRAYNAALERLIVRHPEQWFWVHRRWKGRP